MLVSKALDKILRSATHKEPPKTAKLGVLPPIHPISKSRT